MLCPTDSRKDAINLSTAGKKAPVGVLHREVSCAPATHYSYMIVSGSADCNRNYNSQYPLPHKNFKTGHSTETIHCPQTSWNGIIFQRHHHLTLQQLEF
ncbi:hypothetical protein XELAEV_18043509mg [Xenopus laevis]|uniref:Uncharacterized protein n=1 Tax=Xenopus laevis TaxID=8355 RepID=A0A974BWT2_XENLA|nr:hypothetical protein XELAEV_18043509mg [Xenopus laevis]